MMRIDCPWCGPRDEYEFVYGGPSHVSRPSMGATDEAWGEYLFMRDNPKGNLRERWRHAYGCGQWFNLIRDSATHRISAVYKMDDPAP